MKYDGSGGKFRTACLTRGMACREAFAVVEWKLGNKDVGEAEERMTCVCGS